MKCDEVERYLYAFLESQTSLKENLEIQEHLDTCPRCSREATIEREITWRLREDALWEDPPADLLEKIRQRVEAAAATRRPWWGVPFTRLRYGVALALLLMVVGSALWWSSRSALPLPPLVAGLVADYERMGTPHGEDLLKGSDVQQVKATLAKELGFDFPVPSFATSRIRLVGGRICPLGEVQGGNLVFEANGRRLLYYAMPKGSFDLAGLRTTSVQGRLVRRGSHKGHNMLIWEMAGLYGALVSDLPEADLLHLAETAFPPGWDRGV